MVLENLKKILPTIIMVGIAILLFKTCTGGKTEEKTAGVTNIERMSKENHRPMSSYEETFEAKKVSLGSLDPKSGYKLKLDLTSDQAAVEAIKLTDYYQTVADKQLFKSCKDYAEYQKKYKEDPKKYKGNYTLVSPVVGKERQFTSLGTNHITAKIGADKSKNIVRNSSLKKGDKHSYLRNNHNWKLVSTTTDKETGTQTAVFELPLLYSAAKKPLSIARKTFTVKKDSYTVGVNVQIINKTSESISFGFTQEAVTGFQPESKTSDKREIVYGYESEGEVDVSKKINQSDLPKKASNFFKWKSIGTNNGDKKGIWVGESNQFFGAMLYPKPSNDKNLAITAYDLDFQLEPVKGKDDKKYWQSAVKFSAIALPGYNGEGQVPSRSIDFDFYAGPKTRALLDSDNPLYAKLKYIDTLNTSACFMQIPLVTKGLMGLLGLLGSLFGNYGIAIMILVAIVRVILHPLAKKSQINMAMSQKKMAALKPKIDKIKEKYKDNPQMASMEQMKLTREAGIFKGQMLGCLPMLLQMPIWISLFSGLNSEVMLRHAAFLPVWITDLSAPDALVTFGSSIPLIGKTFNLLPILLAIAMFYQSKMNPSMNQATQTPEQEQQQKMMKVMMPLMMLVFFYNMPSGLTLYIMSSTVIGAIEQRRIREYIKQHQEILDPSLNSNEIIVDAPGKAARGSRSKKVKGAWVKKK